MTDKIIALAWDKEFIEGRIKEQKEYIENLPKSYSTHDEYGNDVYYDVDEREAEVLASAEKVLARLERQLENINKLQ
jgi:hypothetical protein